MKLIFIHGWAFNAEFWKPISNCLDHKFEIEFIDLGFFNAEVKAVTFDSEAVYVGHSFGVMWFLKHAPTKVQGFTSICGFDRFVPHINPRIIKAMQKGLERNIQHQLKTFWSSCALPNYHIEAKPDKEQLSEGLLRLANWDCRKNLEDHKSPKLIIATEDDKIVPKQMSCDIWGQNNITWHDKGGHALPLTHPEWVSEKLTEFINDLRQK